MYKWHILRCLFHSVQGGKPKKKDRIQDLIDIGYGYDEEVSLKNKCTKQVTFMMLTA